jgi:transposase
MGHLLMSERERQLKALFEMVKNGHLTRQKVAEQVSLSYRQIKRLYKRYQIEGDEGLIHKARGRVSNRKHPQQKDILNRYQERYEEFGATLAAEKLLEDGFKVDHETLRQWLLSEGLLHRRRARKAYRQRRERRAQFGELVQMDGSIHDWLGEGKFTCLINMVDDATGKTLSRLETGETTEGVFLTLRSWVEQYGVPLALYVDLKSVYVPHKEDNWGHFSLACERLGIQLIKAYSPQAKGRVERNHAVYQDRFVKELKLKNIHTIEGANTLLSTGFIENLNKRFEKVPRCPLSAHRSSHELNLHHIFCWEYQRVLRNDWTFSFEKRLFQIKKSFGDLIRPKSKIGIKRHLNGELSFWHRNNQLFAQEIIDQCEKPKLMQAKKDSLSPSEIGRLGKKSSPWGQFSRYWVRSSAKAEAL